MQELNIHPLVEPEAKTLTPISDPAGNPWRENPC
jgi:hypothetical protein